MRKVAIWLTLLLNACASAAAYRQPQVEIPDRLPGAARQPGAAGRAPPATVPVAAQDTVTPVGEYWRALGDTTLDRLLAAGAARQPRRRGGTGADPGRSGLEARGFPRLRADGDRGRRLHQTAARRAPRSPSATAPSPTRTSGTRDSMPRGSWISSAGSAGASRPGARCWAPPRRSCATSGCRSRPSWRGCTSSCAAPRSSSPWRSATRRTSGARCSSPANGSTRAAAPRSTPSGPRPS